MPKKDNERDIKNKNRSKTPERSVVPVTHSDRNELFVMQIIPYIIVVLSILIIFAFAFEKHMGWFGFAVRKLFFGLVSGAAWFIPFILFNIAIFWKRDLRHNNLKFKIILSSVCLVLFAACYHYFVKYDGSKSFSELWKSGISGKSGGIIGGYLAIGIKKLFGSVGTPIFLISLIAILFIFMFGLTPAEVGAGIRKIVRNMNARREEQKKIKNDLRKERYISGGTMYNDTPKTTQNTTQKPPVQNDIFAERKRQEQRDFNPDVPIDDEDFTDEYDDYADEEEKSVSEKKTDIDLNKIFVEKRHFDDDFISDFATDEESNVDKDIDIISVVSDSEKTEITSNINENISEITPKNSRTPLSTPIEPEKPKYVFPPITLLTADTENKNIDASSELRMNAERLVQTLESFKVRTKVINISRGPTITRYELAPEEGVRVRAIANLVDDIALNLASTGVRIEAPIPGKAAVGVEVPNQIRTTVYLRTLIEDKRFEQSKGRLTCALGVDVAGEPIYPDLSKMPHLLIAGTTGSGKSVTINCLIISLLYKYSPDEVRFVLIDPKKVEFNVYNGLPHLIVPVVSNPKKAAGALSWAVNEMERRFELIESVGARDITGYNKIIKGDPEKEQLTQIVIVIDELADLMLTAKDAVEESVCRLAQKARAAGMHLIIGTQRPSVDVITGLIKANIPSRIACTVSSQVDSRTIIDIAGAEKLIGRGDMLYAPLGSPKPMRVQGAFVSEGEVEEVVEFIKSHSGESRYDKGVMEDIEREAQQCGAKGKQSDENEDIPFDEASGDPMFYKALELAIESGKISTSLLQRRLSLGYGRAAKIIDQMEKLGFVSAPEGQKPRNVLITKEEYMEMRMRNKDIDESID